MPLEVNVPSTTKEGVVGGTVMYTVKVRNGASTSEVHKVREILF